MQFVKMYVYRISAKHMMKGPWQSEPFSTALFTRLNGNGDKLKTWQSPTLKKFTAHEVTGGDDSRGSAAAALKGRRLGFHTHSLRHLGLCGEIHRWRAVFLLNANNEWGPGSVLRGSHYWEVPAGLQAFSSQADENPRVSQGPQSRAPQQRSIR